MRSIATDGVASSVCRSVCHDREPCKNGRIDRDTVRDVDSVVPKEPCVRWGPDPHVKGFLRSKRGPGHIRTCPTDDILKATQQAKGQNRHGADSDWCTHWRNLANTVQPSVCSDDTALSNYFDHLLNSRSNSIAYET